MDTDTNVSTTDKPYVTALEYAQAHNLSKQWILKLAREGRFEGAYQAGICWLIPRDEPLPMRIRPGPKPKVRPESEAERKNLAKWNADWFKRNENSPPMYMPENEQHTLQRRIQGCTRVYSAWKLDGVWIGPIWLRNMSKEEFEARQKEFTEWEDSEYTLPRPDWMPLDE